jgi:hypothetical protein
MTTASSVQMGSEKSASQSFVINLASSTSPMALAHPSSPELKRYTFFVSRQREDGRERFRLHMGYFTTQEDAESLLAAVRDVYPAAWAGPAPTNGVARRGKISPVQLAPAVAHAASASAPAAAVAPAVAMAPAPAAKPVEPELKVSAATVVAQPEAPADIAALEQSMSSMRNALAQLAGDAPIAPVPNPPTVQPMQLKQPAQRIEPPRLQATQANVPVARPLPPKPVVQAKPAVEPKPAELTPVQALHVLEAEPVRAAPPAPPPPVKASALPALKSPFEVIDPTAEVPVVTPEDTQTLTDIKLDKQNNAPPCFAVQLVWSVSPIDVASLAHLAIFDAYTLYNVEGNRQGRKWYGLRLGFFSDPNSATQVAHYVRSDYRAVAVVPVANKERDRARGVVATPAAMDPPAAPLQAREKLSTHKDAMNGFELLTDDRPVPQKRDIEAPADAKASTATRAQVAKALGNAGVQVAAPAKAGETVIASKGKRVVVRKRQVDAVVHAKNPGAAAVMESTLEILGASTLTLDDGRAVISDDALARKPGAGKKAGNGKFSRLLSRLGGG